MRILSVLHVVPPEFSGATNAWMRLAPKIAARGVAVDMLCRLADGEIVLRRGGRPNLSFPEPLGFKRGGHWAVVLTIISALWRLRHEYECVLFVSGFDALFAALLAKPLLSMKLTYRMSMLGEDDPIAIRGCGRFGWLRAMTLKWIDAAICINPAMAEKSVRFGIDSRRVFTVLQGIDGDVFFPTNGAKRSALREQYGIPAPARVVLFCGGIVERKGVDLLLKAWQVVLAQSPEAQLLLAGPEGGPDDPGGRFRASMISRIEQPEYRNSIRFIGLRNDIPDLMRASDVFVLPSRMEGTPNVVLAAMASGLPVVLTELGGVSGVFVRDQSEGFVVPQEDWQTLANRLGTLLRDENLAARIGESARERAVSEYSLDLAADQYIAILRQVGS